MAKLRTLLIPCMLVTMIYATSASAEVNSGVETACKKSPDAKFCTELLNPYASQFVDNDSNKMGYAAISATVSQVQAMRAFMVRQTTEPEASEEEKSAVKECLSLVGKSDDSLRRASQEFDLMQAANGDQHNIHKDNVIRNIDSAKTDLTACLDLLKKHKAPSGGGAGEVLAETVRQADRSVLACSVAQSFLH